MDTSVTTTKKIKVDELAVAVAATQAEVNAMTSTNTLLTPNINTIVLSTEQASTSGTAIDFTGIPAGVRRITVMFDQVSLSGTDNFLVQIGDAGGIENTGYISGSITIVPTATLSTSTAGLVIRAGTAARTHSGTMVLNLEDSAAFTWVASHVVVKDNAGTADDIITGSGIKALSAELTQIRITRTGTDTFDAGAVNIQIER